jgi:hypothetical protein
MAASPGGPAIAAGAEPSLSRHPQLDVPDETTSPRAANCGGGPGFGGGCAAPEARRRGRARTGSRRPHGPRRCAPRAGAAAQRSRSREHHSETPNIALASLPQSSSTRKGGAEIAEALQAIKPSASRSLPARIPSRRPPNLHARPRSRKGDGPSRAGRRDPSPRQPSRRRQLSEWR